MTKFITKMNRLLREQTCHRLGHRVNISRDIKVAARGAKSIQKNNIKSVTGGRKENGIKYWVKFLC